jgi:hypothetical protein
MILRDRSPSVSGTFYESTPSSLRERLKWCFLDKVGPGKLPEVPEKSSKGREIISIVSPHAGYVYSGPVAAHGYYQLSLEPAPDLVVIIGPNHTGMGAGVSVWPGGNWKTPLGNLSVDSDSARALCEAGVAEGDDQAHLEEHSIEVQLPFLQFVYGNKPFKILPVCMLLQDHETACDLGRALSQILTGKSALIVASTDFTHYEPYREAYEKDERISKAIIAMDSRRLFETVARGGLSMCGPGPVMVAIEAAKGLGASECEKLCYATSGDTSGSKDQVVGYGSFLMRKKAQRQ